MFECVKGTRDLLPEDKILMQRMEGVLREVFELYGYSPLETPCLQDAALLESKYGGGAEILKETYRLTDQGGRKLGLRYDFTVPLARLVAANKQLPRPFKRYEIGKTWRDGPIKLGRYREFWQCDVDVIGPSSMLADAELVALANTVFERLGLDVKIKVNNRKLLDGVLDNAGVVKEKKNTVLQSLDKLAKTGEAEVRRELAEKKIDAKSIDKLLKTLSGASLEKLGKLGGLAAEGVRELQEFFDYAEKLGVKNSAWEATLSRGLDYYTGTVFEAYSAQGAVKSSLAGGGRFDNMIAAFAGLDKPVPAVGISFGLNVIMDALREKNSDQQKTVVQAFVIPVGSIEPALRAACALRAAGVNTEIDVLGRGLSKNLDYASTLCIPFCIIVGPKDAEQDCVTLRDMKTGEQKKVRTGSLAEFFNIKGKL